jgi:DNA-binding response OmpR family regulator
VLLAEDSRALNKQLTRETVDLIVLDLMLPGEDGLTICRRLRAANDQTPIIMLTAKVEDVDRIVGLEVGADDYLAKPFNPRELLARINAVLRRRPPPEAPGAPSKEPMTVTFGPFEFDLALRRLMKNGEQRPRVRALRPQPGRADLAPAQDAGSRPGPAALHPDRVGRGLRFRTRREQLGAMMLRDRPPERSK